jgi:uncharacterized protein
MILHHILEKDQKETTWSGGITREIFIFPPGSTLRNRDFDMRISTATIQSASSVFTSLPGFSREIMVMEGELEIVHENQYSRKLGRLEGDSFLGEWHTTSFGRVIDFNLITSSKFKGSLTPLVLRQSDSLKKRPSKDRLFIFYYVISGGLFFESDSKITAVSTGEMIGFQSDGEVYSLTGDCELIEVSCRFL